MGKSNSVIPLTLQDLYIKKQFEGFSVNWLKRDYECVWNGRLQPIEGRTAYTVVIHYKLGGIPKVSIKSPALKETAPHRFKDGSLCLYKPGEWSWSGREFISNTILPWTASWLYYYELWLDTDIWYGPEASHDSTPKEPEKKGKNASA